MKIINVVGARPNFMKIAPLMDVYKRRPEIKPILVHTGVDNLKAEGIPDEKIHLVGNVMIDTLLRNKAKAERSTILDDLNLNGDSYAIMTLHRPANVDDPQVLGQILEAVDSLQHDMPVIFPIHPRTRRNVSSGSLAERLDKMPGLRLLYPIGYLDFMKLMSKARLVMTDSGGVQEETTILEVPCVTLRENTERPVTVEFGNNRIVGTDPKRIIAACREIIANNSPHQCRTPPLWDGKASKRIVRILLEEFHGNTMPC